MMEEAEALGYEGVLKQIAELRQQEAAAKEVTRGLKFSYVESRSKVLFLEALKNEMDLSALQVDFPSAEEVKHAKNQSKEVLAHSEELESRIMKQIEQISEYQRILQRLQPSPDQENVPSTINVPSNASGTPSNGLIKCHKMLSWYQTVIASLQVLSGISVEGYEQTADCLTLTLRLSFSKHLAQQPHVTSVPSTHKLLAHFHSEEESLTGATVSPPSLPPWPPY